jgi:methylated-DNA-[protein]-cysteine S-methyltransferase
MIATSPVDLAADSARVHAAKLKTPFAVLGIRTFGGYLTGIEYLPRGERAQAPADALAERACRQLERYLADPQFRFTLPLAPQGTPFRRRVWDALASIPVGESRTYGEMARRLATAPRAVGGACGANPIALVIPCHRVVGSQGSLGGFMGAIDGDPIAIKRWLLAHEGYRFGR